MSDVAMIQKTIKHCELTHLLRQKIDEVLRPLISINMPVALLDFPQSSNVGDCAIWLGQQQVLKALKVRIVYMCDKRTYSLTRMKKKISADTTILLNGGGNFGDLWPVNQVFREHIVRNFQSHRIIQFPQSICFRDHENLKRAKEVINRHPNFTLLLRDQKSYDFAKEEFQVKAILCPDMAFGIELQKSVGRLGEKIIVLSRKDIEGDNLELSGLQNNGIQIEKIDWPMLDRVTPFIKLDQILSHSIHKYPRAFGLVSDVSSLLYDGVAERRFKRACDVLGTARVVITNRLHGHIVCLLLGIPHVCVDNTIYGKIRNYYDTWTKDSSITYWANSFEDALEMAQGIVGKR